MKSMIFCGLVLLLASVGSAATINVPDEQPTIAAALTVAVSGDTVSISTGNYTEHDLEMKSGVCLRSATGDAQDVTIDANGQGRCIHGSDLAGSTSILGLTLTGGSTSEGGGMYLTNSPIEVSLCVLIGNQASTHGGGLALDSSADPTFTGCEFTENNGWSGGGVYIATGGSPVFNGCSFTGNTTNTNGGGIYAEAVNLGLSLCTFSDNNAVYSGGGVYLLDAVVSTLDHTNFTGNAANDGGGGLMCYNSSPTITDCGFALNTADWGGAMSVEHSGGGSSAPTITGGTWSSNTAAAGSYGYGGGLYLEDTASATVEDVRFITNQAVWGGAVCSNAGSTPHFDNCRFESNQSASSETAQGGGAACIMGTAHLTATACTFKSNSTTYMGGAIGNWSTGTPEFTSCIFHDNTGRWGGAYYGENNSTAVFTSCTMVRNEVTDAADGAGISVWTGAAVDLNRSIICDSGAGSAVHRESDSTINLVCCDLWNNAGGDWVDGIESQATTDDNFSANPQFCGVAGTTNFYLQSDSPCTAAVAGCSQIVGALGINCNETSTEATSWSAVKAMY
ncbi:MAG: hypothetical protein GY835_17195 [bacterium]|nr:hypothetical protein [bacterium]